ncbi:alpha/beta fold hydrolase [Neomegalonema sp.]|uniref:alpha/beta fold hydrolase n=1 Tax=Neomegalonema sp. TaxID=2039713 RepID=UPI0026262594|nr:alpha/beta hydrolase [Neomegalonema sp.]MDD2868441.1 alpha/beta hydrolase [Neomegalonema sp.]
MRRFSLIRQAAQARAIAGALRRHGREQRSPPYAPEPTVPEGAEGFWVQPDQRVRLRAAFWPGSGRGFVILLQGRAEFLDKYVEAVGEWRARGFAVLAFDWRGQGLSTRQAADRRLGYVEDFKEFQQDLQAVLDHPLVLEIAGPKLMVGHSMGGAIGVEALGGPLRERFAGAVFTAPMLGISLEPGVERLARRLSARFVRIKLGQRRAFGQERRSGAERPFENNSLTSDERRFNVMAQLLKANPELAIGGPSWAWLAAAFREIDALAARPRESLGLPCLVFTCERDTVVQNAAIDVWAEREPLSRLVNLLDCRHDAWMESDAIRQKLWREIDGYLGERGL